MHVWRANLDELDGRTHARLAALLSEEERARATRLLSEHKQLLWTRARGVLRDLLARYLRCDGRELRLSTDARGKPTLASPTAVGVPADRAGAPMPSVDAHTDAPSFNLSHSGALALYAFSGGAAVGVDVESNARRMLDEVALATRVFGADTGNRLRSIADPAARQREFLRAWTRYEAELKCLGAGIGSGVPATLRQGLWVAELEVRTGAIGAVACERVVTQLRCWTWA